MTTSSSPGSEVFKFQHCPTNSVRVENISARTTISEVVALFNTLVGGVKSSRIYENSDGSYLEIMFSDHVSASLSICSQHESLSDVLQPLTERHYVCQDTMFKAPSCRLFPQSLHVCALRCIVVSPTTFPLGDARPKRQIDDRQNLYVLGLPFSLTKAEFSSLFSHYGTVSHCVILATVDNSSRRRGFVVMSTHEEAKLAMASLTRTQIKGHCLDISWAVVQRSHGFLDGGDRAMLMDSRTTPATLSRVVRHPTPDNHSADSSASSIGPNNADLSFLALSLVPTPTLLVTNLPTLLFSQTQDMHPLFYPFGLIKKLKLVETPTQGSTAVVVEYGSAEIAQEAKETLHGEHYAGHQIAVRYVRSKSSLSDLASASDAACYNTNAPDALDPFARQFSPLLGPSEGPYFGSQPLPRFNSSRYIPPGLQHTYLRAPHPAFSFNHRQRNISRSSSASSR
ncbi:putative RNA-binding protein C4F6.14 [Hypsizygus marmoreus]|uniref:RNA-binding protein C4F6.14 n=1 Tax=Hypsizygus marmoreus TaxID=39966 RepID=A0A369K517_HYPMA|nr:putative RNA-binding protein C4F6.14 [Hypsizygus marmoreus]